MTYCLYCGRPPETHGNCRPFWVREADPIPKIRESSNDDRYRMGRDPVRYWAYQKAYRQRPETKARHRERDLAYSRRPEVIARRALHASPSKATRQQQREATRRYRQKNPSRRPLRWIYLDRLSEAAQAEILQIVENTTRA